MKKTDHEWSKEAFFSKAQLYAEAMSDHDDSNWQFGLWSAFAIEMLVRAGVAATSPVLVAENQDWNNLLYALGTEPKKQKFVAKSASITEMVIRVQDLCSEFTREHANFCTAHIARRNSEVHSGSLPFENLGSSAWLPMFYSVCSVLLTEIGESLESLFGDEIAKQAKEDIDALADDAAKSVKGIISAHKEVWLSKSGTEKVNLEKQAKVVSLRHYGHRIDCPSCSCTALVQGKATGAPKRKVEDDGILERQQIKPESFQCVACGLKISGYSKLLAAGLGDTFISTSHYDAMEFFEVDIAEHFRGMIEEDYNE